MDTQLIGTFPLKFRIAQLPILKWVRVLCRCVTNQYPRLHIFRKENKIKSNERPKRLHQCRWAPRLVTTPPPIGMMLSVGTTTAGAAYPSRRTDATNAPTRPLACVVGPESLAANREQPPTWVPLPHAGGPPHWVGSPSRPPYPSSFSLRKHAGPTSCSGEPRLQVK